MTMYQQFMTRQLADQHVAELRQKGAQERLAKVARAQATSASYPEVAATPRIGLRGTLATVWKALTVRPAPSNT